MLKQTAKYLIARSRLPDLSRVLRRRQTAILMYHGLTRDSDCREWTQVQLGTFEAQMRFLRAHYDVMPLADVITSLALNHRTHYAAAITFDDGYRSVAELAAPVLQALALPSTVFVSSGFIAERADERRYMWPDMVSESISFSESSELDLRAYRLGLLPIRTALEKQRATSLLKSHLKSVPVEERDRILETMRGALGDLSAHEQIPEHRPMTWEQLMDLSADPLFEVGGHTISHPILSRLPADCLHQEIVGGKEEVEQRIGSVVRFFAYPNGRREDISEAALEVVRGSFRAALTTEAGLNRPGCDPYLVRRIAIGSDLSFDEFVAVLSGIYQ